MSRLIFGFDGDDFADPTAQLTEQGVTVETFTVQDGETATDQHGTYTTTTDEEQ